MKKKTIHGFTQELIIGDGKSEKPIISMKWDFSGFSEEAFEWVKQNEEVFEKVFSHYIEEEKLHVLLGNIHSKLKYLVENLELISKEIENIH